MPENVHNPLDKNFLRFLPKVYQAANAKAVDPIPLLHSLEYAREVATGTQALLRLLRNNENLKTYEDAEPPLSHASTDQLLALSIASLNLLNERIEAVADHYAEIVGRE